MAITDFHAKYVAHELTKRCASDNVEKLAAVLADAQVDLNPHQVEAVLFACRSPFSKDAILADEVGVPRGMDACAAGRWSRWLGRTLLHSIPYEYNVHRINRLRKVLLKRNGCA